MSKKIAVIGAGPGGYPAAFRLAELGAKVTLIEKEEIGGVCLNWGCIPSKSYLDIAYKAEACEKLADFASDKPQESGKVLSWDKIQNRRKLTISKIKKGLEQAFKSKKIKLIKGRAGFVSDREIIIKTKEETLKEIFDCYIIACGSESFFPPPLDKLRGKLLDNKTIFSLEKLPASLIIAGGGVIGAEFAYFFATLGVKIDIAEIMPDILPGEDENLVRAVKSSLTKKGVGIHLGSKITDIKISEEGKTVVFENGKTLKADNVLVAAGRVFESRELGLENTKIKSDSKAIMVDENFKASDNIYAVGDANGQMMLAHAASAQGVYVANLIMGKNGFYDNNLVPRCIYTHPEIASVGLDKTSAEKKGLRVKVQRAFFASNGKAQSTGETEGFVQIVSDAENSRILGAQIAGQSATEIIHILSVAISAKMTTENLKKVIFAHPTMSETISQALER